MSELSDLLGGLLGNESGPVKAVRKKKLRRTWGIWNKF